MTAFVNHFTYEFKTGLRNPNHLMMNYLFPMGFYVLMGLVFTQVNPVFRNVMLPAMIQFTAMVGMILGLPNPLVEAREAGVFRSFKINGVPATSILAIPALSAIVHATIACIIIGLTAGPLFKGDQPVFWLPFVLITFLSILNFAALGSLIGVVSASTRATVLWSQLIFLPSMLLGGMMVPTSMLPQSVQAITALMPTTHAMAAYTAYAYGVMPAFNPAASVIILGVSTVLAFGLAIYLFNWDSRNTSRRGHPLMALLVLLPYIAGIFIK